MTEFTLTSLGLSLSLLGLSLSSLLYLYLYLYLYLHLYQHCNCNLHVQFVACCMFGTCTLCHFSSTRYPLRRTWWSKHYHIRTGNRNIILEPIPFLNFKWPGTCGCWPVCLFDVFAETILCQSSWIHQPTLHFWHHPTYMLHIQFIESTLNPINCLTSPLVIHGNGHKWISSAMNYKSIF